MKYLIGGIFAIIVVGYVGHLAFEAANEASTPPVATQSPSTPSRTQLKAEYIDQYLQLYDFQMSRYQSDDWATGVTFKLRNKGLMTLELVEVTVFFKDKSGQTLGEQKFQPVHSPEFEGGMLLKPGYIWQPEPGRYYRVKNKPTEANGPAEARITDIEFASP